ncbi:hypothetical protein [Hymenobacter seoulensis]
MHPLLPSCRIVFLVLASLISGHAYAQQPTTRPLVISPVVGPIIDSQEKVLYELFPYYTPKEFVEGSFEQVLAPDSAIRLRATLNDGRTIVRPIPLAEYFAMRQRIEAKAQLLSSGSRSAAADSIGQTYRVTLRSGTTFAGRLVAVRPLELEFSTNEPGAVIIARSQIANMQLVPQVEMADAMRHPTWGYVGNGTRVFFSPTARNLRAGEGYVQTIDVFLLGANYGFTDNFSMGLLASAIPGLGIGNQIVAITPKFSAPISKDWSLGAGLLYARIPAEDDISGYTSSYGAGIAYGLATYGSADNNLTFGLGYGFTGEGNGNQGFGKSPVAVLSGTTRVSKKLSLMSENYLITSGDGGVGGLYGIRLNWPRTTFGIGSFYVAPFGEEGAFGYLYPVYLDLALRFGKTAQR